MVGSLMDENMNGRWNLEGDLVVCGSPALASIGFSLRRRVLWKYSGST